MINDGAKNQIMKSYCKLSDFKDYENLWFSESNNGRVLS